VKAAFGVGAASFDEAYLKVAGEPVATAFAPPMGWFNWWRTGNRR
jgi:hypothetical protein